MKLRSVLVDPYQRAEIAAIEEVANEPYVLKILPRLDLQNILLASLLQAGAEVLELGTRIDADGDMPPVLAKRVTFGPSRDWALLTTHVFHAIGQRSSPDYLKGPKGGRIAQLGFFLVAILHAAKRQGAWCA